MESKTQTPFFSIAVPIYNVSKYLPQCIESVLNQSFQDFELILVDDGSKDNSGEICDHFQKTDDRIQVIHKPNGGLVSARIAGIRAAKGKYIYNLDGDDFIESDLLSKLHEIAIAHDPDMISFGYQTIDERNTICGPYTDSVPEGLYTENKLEELYSKLVFDPQTKHFNACSCIQFSIWSKAFKREWMLPIENRIPTSISRGEDVAAVMTALCRCETLYVAHFVGYNYRIQNASMTRTFQPKGLTELITLVKFLKENATKIPERNAEQFAMTEIFYHTKDAVCGFTSFADYKGYLSIVYTEEILSIIKNFELGYLSFSKKLQIWAIKNRWWLCYWMVYKSFHRITSR